MRLTMHHVYRNQDDDAGGAAPADEPGAATEPEAGATDEPASMEDAVLASLEGEEGGEPAAEEPAGATEPAAEAAANPAQAAADAAVDGSVIDPLKALDPNADPDAPADPDAELAEPPKGLSKRGQERWNTMNERLREHRTRADAAEARIAEVAEQHNGLVDQITGTGASREEFGRALQYMSAIHSDDPAQLTQARQVLQAELAGVEQRLGIVPTDSTVHDQLIAAHPDVAQMVANMEMTREAALQVVTARQQNAAQAQRMQVHTQTQAQQDQQQAIVQQENAALEQVSQMETYLRARDPSYARKERFLLEAVREIRGLYPPHQWVERVGEAYKRITRHMQAAAPGGPSNKQQQPMRSAGGAPAGRVEPSSMGEAVLQSLNME